MVYHHLFDLRKGSSSVEALAELALLFSDLYEIEDVESGCFQIGGYSAGGSSDQAYTHVTLKDCHVVEPIDWGAQWAAFAPRFDGEHSSIPVGSFQLLLGPGAGFGDCSHPTTRLMLSMLSDFVKDKVVLDIGCGSGVLSIAAALLGAKRVYGIDIELESIEHSVQNALLNGVETQVFFSSVFDPSLIRDEEVVILMNMIHSQQRVAWESAAHLQGKQAQILTSGILSSEGDSYKEFVYQNWGWSFREERELEGWMGFLFLNKGDA